MGENGPIFGEINKIYLVNDVIHLNTPFEIIGFNINYFLFSVIVNNKKDYVHCYKILTMNKKILFDLFCYYFSQNI